MTDWEDVENEVRRAIDNLGETPEEIAESLRERGICGRRRDPPNCPIARYLEVEVNQGFVFSNTGIFVFIEDKEDPLDDVAALSDSVVSRFSAELQKFTSRFDRGKYPDLVEGDNGQS